MSGAGNADESGLVGRLIAFSAKNRYLMLVFVAAMALWGVYGMRNGPLDAIPDLSDVQVIIYTDWPGQSPDLVEDQITYPISSTLLSAPKVKAVRGQSFFGSSFVYVIFEDGTDMYWARSRVLEYLNTAQGRLPAGRHAHHRAGRHRRGLGVPVRAGGRDRRDRPVAAAQPAGLVSALRPGEPCPALPKSPAWAATSSSTRSISTPTSCAATASASTRWCAECALRTRTPVAASSKSRARSRWFAAAAT